ncbi:MAG: ABC transporter substrate-binding protein [Deltaproteobacteria bacterium]|nr:ABC transporter substrate-binding protein [Deltaproteobacteria bacterium]
MRITGLNKIVVSFGLLLLMLAPTHGLAASPDLQKAKQEAEAKGYIFFTTHDEIVAMAKKEGKLRVDNRLNSPNYKPLINGFKQKYAFVSDISVEELQGHEAFQRYLLEIKSGQAKGDVVLVSPSVGGEYMPYMMKYDILGMAKHGVLKIHPGMIHPVRRNVIGISSAITVVPYNRKLISEDKVPATWEDFLKPEFKGKKFIVNISPTDVVPLVPAWGLEKTVDFAGKIAAQQPAWGSGGTRTTSAILAGEHPLLFGSAYNTVKRLMMRDPTGNFSYKIVEPVPTLIVDDATGVLHTADHPHVALLWLEFLASPEAQEIIDKHEPFIASVFTPGSAIAHEIRGKKLSAVDWNHVDKFIGYREKIFAAYGFPKADKKK